MVEAKVLILINKSKIAWFARFKFLITLKLNFNGGVNFIEKYKILVVSKSLKIHNKIVKFVGGTMVLR